MSRRGYPYPDDEFDVQRTDAIRPGEHRAPEPRWRGPATYITAIVVCAALGVGAVWLLPRLAPDFTASLREATTPSATASASTSTPSPEASESESASAQPSESASTEPSPTASAEPSPTASQAALDYSITVRVLNASGVGGLAGSAAQTLIDAGWVGAVADNLPADQTRPDANVVYYRSAEDLPAAEEIAQELGIDSVSEVPTLVAPVSVVLVAAL